jgi:hypothetical protein
MKLLPSLAITKDWPGVYAKPRPTVKLLDPVPIVREETDVVAYLSPDNPFEPDVPLVPELPDVPVVPLDPDVPVVPEVPEVPVPPVAPDVPEVPVVPDVPFIPPGCHEKSPLKKVVISGVPVAFKSGACIFPLAILCYFY